MQPHLAALTHRNIFCDGESLRMMVLSDKNRGVYQLNTGIICKKAVEYCKIN